MSEPRTSLLSRLSQLPKPYNARKVTWSDDSDLKSTHKQISHAQFLALTFASVGIIYGDIGTSPLYAISSIFTAPPTGADDVLGVVSLIFWTLTLLCIVKYMGVVLLADDNGEGGTFALFAVICRSCHFHPITGSVLDEEHAESDARISRYDRIGLKSDGGGSGAGAGSSSGGGAGSSSGGDAAPQQGQAAPLEVVTPQKRRSLAERLRAWAVALFVPTGAARLGCAGAALKQALRGHAGARRTLLALVLLMTAMVLADGVLTPAISVLSAVEGLRLKTDLSTEAELGITCALLLVIFGIQYMGTGHIGFLFAPIVLLWFVANTGVAIYNLATYQGALAMRALSPHYAVAFFQQRSADAWVKLGSVFLVVTGCEAMYADMGHFTPNAVRASFGLIAYPALVLTYLGQGAYLLHHPDAVETLFFSAIPTPVFWPVFVVSLGASFVASQALITSAFSIVVQSMALGCFPRLEVRHMSKDVGGQVFVPVINLLLMLLSLAVVLGFRSTAAIGYSYGITVNVVMVGTTGLVGIVMLVAWGCSLPVTLLFVLPFTFIEAAFLSSNLLKVPEGGWFSIVIATTLVSVMYLWWWGSTVKAEALKRNMVRLDQLLTHKQCTAALAVGQPDHIAAVHGDGNDSNGSSWAPLVSPWQLFRASSLAAVERLPGMAIIYADSAPDTVPLTFKRLVDHWGVHQLVVFTTVRRVALPAVADSERLLVAPLELVGFYRCIMRYGYLEKVRQGPETVEAMLSAIRALSVPAPSHHASCRLLPLLSTTTDSGRGQPWGGGTNSMRASLGPAYTMANAAEGQRAWGETGEPAALGAHAVHVDVAHSDPVRVVRVLQRPIFRPQENSNPLRGALVRAYGTLWALVQRGWEEWDVPVSSLFELGMILEL